MSITPALTLFIFYLLFTCIQLAYYLGIFSRLAFYKQKNSDSSNKPVSIIICAHNEAANVRNYLPSILSQDYHINGLVNYEVLVVDDNSTDDTRYVLEEIKKDFGHLSILHLSQESQYMRGKKFPLSMGIKQAKYDLVLLTDADCVPSSDQWLQKMTAGFGQSKEIVLGYSPYSKREGNLNKKIRFETFYTAFQYLSFALAKIPYMGVGRNLAYHRQLFFNNKGFSSHQQILSGDDDLFINQVAKTNNTIIQIDPAAFTYSDPKETEEQWSMQKKRHFSASTYYKPTDKFLLGLMAFSHFFMYAGLLGLLLHWPYLLIGLGVFLLRWIVVFICQAMAMKKLKEEDLIPWIGYFDAWMVLYYIKNIPSIFFNRKVGRWK